MERWRVGSHGKQMSASKHVLTSRPSISAIDRTVNTWGGREGRERSTASTQDSFILSLPPLEIAASSSHLSLATRNRTRFSMERNFGRVGAASAKPTHVIKCGYLMKQVCNHGPVRGWGFVEGARSAWWGVFGCFFFFFFPNGRLEVLNPPSCCSPWRARTAMPLQVQ